MNTIVDLVDTPIIFKSLDPKSLTSEVIAHGFITHLHIENQHCVFIT